jgi:hypothetical protein
MDGESVRALQADRLLPAILPHRPALGCVRHVVVVVRRAVGRLARRASAGAQAGQRQAVRWW